MNAFFKARCAKLDLPCCTLGLVKVVQSKSSLFHIDQISHFYPSSLVSQISPQVKVPGPRWWRRGLRNDQDRLTQPHKSPRSQHLNPEIPDEGRR